jgi:hypothetical protein
MASGTANVWLLLLIGHLAVSNLNDISATGIPSEVTVTSFPSLSSTSHMSRSSTPATQISDTASSSNFVPAETEESVRRRHQSDTASQEIGKRLLKGWAMLADECPNMRCYGIPLVRPPKAGGGKDTRMVRYVHPSKVCLLNLP